MHFFRYKKIVLPIQNRKDDFFIVSKLLLILSYLMGV